MAPDGRCKVDLSGGRPSVTALSEDLALVSAKEKDRVVVLQAGPNRGRVGTLKSRAAGDIVVEFTDMEVDVVPTGLVGKYAKG